MLPLCIESSAAKAFRVLKEGVVQKRHDTVDEIKDGFHKCMLEFEDDLNEKYIIIDRKTGQSVHHGQLDLISIVEGSEWWRFKIIELLKADEDEALEQMSWIAEPKSAPDGFAPEDRYLSMVPEDPLPDLCPPVGRDRYIEMIRELGYVSLAQAELLRRAIEYLQKAPAAAGEGNVAQESDRIARVKHFLRDKWAGQNRKARHFYTLLLNGRGSGTDGFHMKIF
ncbi:hypothetical protein N0V86_009193 [Didymella sp. IMI 355093]|nr:hypothetical protein N0V86_009193 [Didymella sp. IMI 355093]